jgi:glycosyltransferase involved in cell wall biosynthesis
MPIGDFRFIQIHKEKFKGIICITEWQKQYVMKHASIPEESIYVSRNAIHPKRFLNNKTERTPFRFIYTSDPSRGLDNFLKMIPMLKSRYPQSTFYIFGKFDQISDESLKFIKSIPEYVFLSPRVSQDQLVIELQKSDVWLYPTCFTETYCISSVEAMASGCLVATNNEAALCEIVHDRGVMVDKNDCTIEEMIQKLFVELCKVLDDPKLKEEITERGYEWALKQDFYRLALDWKKNLLC